MPALAYIAGYCAHAVIECQPCEDCQSQLIIIDRELQKSEQALIDSMSRGGLKFPQPFVVNVVLGTKTVLEHLVSKEQEQRFHAGANQRIVLLIIMQLLLSDTEVLDHVCQRPPSTRVTAQTHFEAVFGAEEPRFGAVHNIYYVNLRV